MPPKIPSSFYYEITSSNLLLRSHPPGRPDIPALIAGKPFWRSPVSALEKKQKKLILSDWTAGGWSPEKRQQVRDALSALLDQGFDLYRLDKGNVIPFDKAFLLSTKFESYCENISFVPRETIIQTAIEQNKTTRDDVQLLDYYWINYLLSAADEPGERVLRTSDLNRLLSKISDTKLIHLAREIELAVPSPIVIHDVFSESANNDAWKLQSFLSIPIRHDYKTLHLSGQRHDLGDFPNIRLGPFNLQDTKMSSIKVIKFYDRWEFSSKTLEKILKTAINIQEIESGLNFYECPQTSSEEILLDKDSLPALEKIALMSGSALDAKETIKTILDAAPHLKEITISSISLHELLQKPRLLNTIEALTATSIQVNADFQSFLIAAKNLKKLCIRNLTIEKPIELTLKPNSLNSLEELDLSEDEDGYSGPSISIAHLENLLKAAPNLKKITSRCNRNLLADFSIVEGSFEKLVKVDLSYSNISAQNLDALLRAAPNITTLNLEGCINLSLEQIPTKSLSKLTELTLPKKISAKNLTQLLKALPRLKMIKFSYDTEDVEPFENPAFETFHTLNEIELTYCSCSTKDLQTLFNAVPNLKELTFYIGFEIKDNLCLEPKSLRALEKIRIFYSNFSEQELINLLMAAPNLQKLELYRHSDKPFSYELNRLLESIPFVICDGFSKDTSNPVPYSHLKETIVIPEKHNPENMKDFVPGSIKKSNSTERSTQKNQKMIIEKLEDYLDLTQKHQHFLPKIRDGICDALSNYFLSLNQPQEWNSFVTTLQQWNGKEPLSTALINYLDTLCIYVNASYFTPLQSPTQYLGDNLADFLEKNSRAMILSNIDHAIAIKPSATSGEWYLYDPNDGRGVLTLNQPDLLAEVKHKIGCIVGVLSEDKFIIPRVDNPDEFIQNGGLKCVNHVGNSDKILERLTNHAFSEKALNGILLRDMSGKPAWARGLSSKNPQIVSFTVTLLEQFIEINSADAIQKLTQSLNALTSSQQGDCIQNIVISKLRSPENLIANLRQSSHRSHYEQALKTWEKSSEKAGTCPMYCQQCLNSEHKKRLIELESTQQVDTLRYELEKQAKSTGHPVFYIGKPDDLVCSSPWIDNQGIMHPSPGGPLYRFLGANCALHPLLIINYEHFDANDLVRFNALLDKEPNADGINLPPNTKILGLMNRNKPECYQGEDFYSRFDKVEHCPLTAEHLKPLETVESADDPAASYDINLYHDPNWKNILLGAWDLNGNTFTYREGKLQKAIDSGKPIKILNGFWGDETFERFWQQIMTHGVRYERGEIVIPKGIRISHPSRDSYQWQYLPSINIKPGLISHPHAKVLNPSSLACFFDSYALEKQALVKKEC